MPSAANLLALDTSGFVNEPIADGIRTKRFWWHRLDPFTQGYTEASWREWGRLHPGKVYGSLLRPFGFSDLAPETLAVILRDCAAFRVENFTWTNAKAGRTFWDLRQEGFPERYFLSAARRTSEAFPPLTPYLGDDGKVYLREAGQ